MGLEHGALHSLSSSLTADGICMDMIIEIEGDRIFYGSVNDSQQSSTYFLLLDQQ